MRKWAVAVLALALLLVGALMPLVVPRHCPVNRRAFERIKEGMTQAAVHAILGGPPGDYRTRPAGPRHSVVIHVLVGLPGFPDSSLEQINGLWEGDEGIVLIEFHPATPGQETVRSVSFKKVAPYSPGLLELARWRLERLKERLLP